MAVEIQKFKGFVGPSYTLKNYYYDCQETIGRFPEYNEAGRGKDGEAAQLTCDSGLTLLASTGGLGPSRDGYVATIGSTGKTQTYWVFGTTLYLVNGVDGSTSGWSMTPIGTIGSTGSGFAATILATSGAGITSFGTLTAGTGYTNGSYYNVPLIGGSGSGATALISVGGGGVNSISIVNQGQGYLATDVLTANNSYLGGAGSNFSVLVGALTPFTFTLNITNAGSGYANGVHLGVPLVGGSGQGATANITVTSGSVATVDGIIGNVGYVAGDTLSVVPGTSFVISGSQNVQYSTDGTTLFIVAGDIGTVYGLHLATNQLQVMGPSQGDGWQPASSTTYIDSYCVFTQRNSNQFFWTDSYSTNAEGLNFATMETNANIAVACLSNNEDLWLFGQNVIEIWYNAGGGTTGNVTFSRRQGILIETGCASAYTVKKLNNTIMWLATDQRGGPIVMLANGYIPTRVSSFAIEQMLAKCTDANIHAATAEAYQDKGHYFYKLDVVGLNTSLIFDVTTYLQTQNASQGWHKRQYSAGIKATRSIAQGHAYYLNKHLTGDMSTGNLYCYDDTNATDNGMPITRIRTSPHVSNAITRNRYAALQVDYTPAPGTSQVVIPQYQIEFSDDGGKTYGDPRVGSLGAVGEYQNYVQEFGFGIARNAVFRVTDTGTLADISGASLWFDFGKN